MLFSTLKPKKKNEIILNRKGIRIVKHGGKSEKTGEGINQNAQKSDRRLQA